MSASSSRPSNKDYSPVPVEPVPETINDGLDPQQEDADAEEDENVYAPNVPLLSRRGRDDGGREPQGNIRWVRKMFNWRPSFGRSDMPAWAPASKKARNWRKITLLTLLATLVASVVALSISTGVLAKQLHHALQRPKYCYSNSWQKRTHLPLNEAWRSANYQLNFPKLFPPLRPSSNFACQAAWERLRYVPCHEKIFNRAWDNGRFNSLFDPDIAYYTEPMCATYCVQEIRTAYQIVRAQCTEDDKFDMNGYFGTFFLDPELEDGPVGVITTLDKRLTHTCRQDPTQPGYNWRVPKCAQVMWDDWAIVDGMNAGNLEGIDSFLKRTSTYSETRSRYIPYNSDDDCDSVRNYNYGRYSESRVLGPAVNSTTCGWCTMDWFQRKLLSWKKNEVRDPKTGDLVSVTDYLTRIKTAGQRCEADAWDRAWNRALRKYKAAGDLDDDWSGEDGKKKKPCKDEEDEGDDDDIYYAWK